MNKVIPPFTITANCNGMPTTLIVDLVQKNISIHACHLGYPCITGTILLTSSEPNIDQAVEECVEFILIHATAQAKVHLDFLKEKHGFKCS